LSYGRISVTSSISMKILSRMSDSKLVHSLLTSIMVYVQMSARTISAN